MKVRTVHYLLAGQMTLWLGLFVSFLVAPDIVHDSQGFSSFGIYARTIVPYGLGFLACGYFTLRAVHAIEYTDRNTTVLARTLVLQALLLLGILLTPYSVSSLLDWSHTIIAGTLFACQLILARWLLSLHSGAFDWLLFGLQFFGSVMAALSLIHLADYMIIGQLIAQLAFWILLDRAVPHVLSAG